MESPTFLPQVNFEPNSEALVETIRSIDGEMALVRGRMSDLADLRAHAAAELYAKYGPTEGARLLGINRNSLYRIVQRFVAGEGLEIDPDSRRQLREALSIALAGAALGTAIAVITDASK
jgi:hypothetical protein